MTESKYKITRFIYNTYNKAKDMKNILHLTYKRKKS